MSQQHLKRSAHQWGSRKKGVLSINDVVNLGESKLTVTGDDVGKASEKAASVDLKPVTKDVLFGDVEDQEETVKPTKKPANREMSPEESAVSAILDDEDFLDEDDPFDPSESFSLKDSFDSDDEISDEEGEDVSEEDMVDEDGAEPGKKGSKEGIRDRIQSRRNRNAVRPGEEELLRSKLIQFLGGGSLLLVVLAAIFFVLFRSNDSQQMYNSALTQFQEKKYSQAISAFNTFIEAYPRNELADDARIKLGQSKIEKEISGSSDNWAEGLKQFENFVVDNRGTKGFVIEQRPILFKYADEITRGAIQSAVNTKKRDYLAIATEARKKVTAYGPESESEMKALNIELDQLYREAESAVLKQEVFDEHLKAIQEALNNNQTLVALQRRRELLNRYPDLTDNKTMKEVMGQILNKEQSLVTSEELNQAALTEERESPIPSPITIAVHTRSQTPGQSEGEAVLVQTPTSCYGLDTITGQPLWQRLTGPVKSFFPVLTDTAPEGVLYFDSHHHELNLVELHTGKLIWRQPLVSADDVPELVTGKPLVHESSIFVATDQNNLYQLDLHSGQLMVRLHFAQPLFGSPALTADEQHCLISGEQELFYYFSLRPLKCEAVSYFGHLPGDIDIPILAMGSLALITQNTGANECTLKVLRTEYPSDPSEFPDVIVPEAHENRWKSCEPSLPARETTCDSLDWKTLNLIHRLGRYGNPDLDPGWNFSVPGYE
ncbi:MAG: PQQ-binding-like beta-propeller repeat protein [Planctomycetaceae bacterium]